MNIKPYYEIVDECIRYVGLEPEDCWDEQHKKWTFYKGSALIDISIFPIRKDEESDYYITFESKIMELPSKHREELFERLLRENAQHISIKFSIRDGWIVCETNRELIGIDFEEAKHCLIRVAEVADDLDDELKELFADE